MCSGRVHFVRFTHPAKMTSAIKFFVLVFAWVVIISCAQAHPSLIRGKKITPTNPPLTHLRHDQQFSRLKNVSDEATKIIRRVNNFLTMLTKGEGNDLSEMQMCKGHKLMSGLKRNPCRKTKQPNLAKQKTNSPARELFNTFNATMNEIRRSQSDFVQCFDDLSQLVINSNRGRFNQTERNIITRRIAGFAKSLSMDVEGVLKITPKAAPKLKNKKKHVNDTNAQFYDCDALSEIKLYLQSTLSKIKSVQRRANILLKKRKAFLMKKTSAPANRKRQ